MRLRIVIASNNDLKSEAVIRAMHSVPRAQCTGPSRIAQSESLRMRLTVELSGAHAVYELGTLSLTRPLERFVRPHCAESLLHRALQMPTARTAVAIDAYHSGVATGVSSYFQLQRRRIASAACLMSRSDDALPEQLAPSESHLIYLAVRARVRASKDFKRESPTQVASARRPVLTGTENRDERSWHAQARIRVHAARRIASRRDHRSCGASWR